MHWQSSAVVTRIHFRSCCNPQCLLLPLPAPCRSIFPYSAAQLSSNDQYKRLLADEHGELTLPKRLLSGACAGMTATALTHPLDTMRLRMALPSHGYKGGWRQRASLLPCCVWDL